MGTLEKELAKIFGNHAPTSGADGRTCKRKKMSAKARALISAAQKKRWAAQRSNPVAYKPKAKRKMSAAGRARIAAAARARWAKWKAAKKK